MSVLIKDTNMPKNCWLCEFCHDVRYYSETISCCSAQEEKMIFPSKSDRDENCPLVEVPPHGDLIDRDVLCDRLLTAWNTADKEKEKLISSMFADVVTPIVAGTPTVIEREK